MYTLFPLFIAAIACAMLGSWLVHDANFRRLPILAVCGWLLIAVLPVVLLAFVAAGWPNLDLNTRAMWMRLFLLPVAALVLLAATVGAFVILLSRSTTPTQPATESGIVGRGLLLAASVIIGLTLLLSLLLALDNGSIG